MNCLLISKKLAEGLNFKVNIFIERGWVIRMVPFVRLAKWQERTAIKKHITSSVY